jgi:uncharacterized protein YqjF (DUF2071 family)
MHPLLAQTEHRPWPLPRGPWLGRQSWGTLLFAHYRVPVATVRRHVPAPLRLQEDGGMTWVGVVPFRMTGVMVRGLPDLPGLSAFPEINVRLYVEHGDRPGVWFLSLDATNPVAVWAARRFFHLPYRRARIQVEPARDGRVAYTSVLMGGGARFQARYGPAGPPHRTCPGGVEHFLTERYCLYARSPAGRLYRTEVHHLPWPLQPAAADVDATELLASHGIAVHGPPALVHYARGVDVLTWAPQLVA